MIDANQWAESVEEQRRDVAEQKEQELAAFNNRVEIFRREAPRLWPELRSTFDTFVNACNQKRDILFTADIGVNNFIVRRKDLPNIWIEVTRRGGEKIEIAYTVGTYEAKYEPMVFQNGHGYVGYVDRNGRPYTTDVIVASALGPIAGLP